jgi:hypothetical protein
MNHGYHSIRNLITNRTFILLCYGLVVPLFFKMVTDNLDNSGRCHIIKGHFSDTHGKQNIGEITTRFVDTRGNILST